jgi:tetratricopeptide (TPR) repeat protein
MGDKDGLALTQADLAEVARRRGDLPAALAGYREAGAIANEIDDKRAVAYALAGIGDVLADRGDLVAARKSYEGSLALRKQTGEKQTAAETELALARLSPEETVIRNCKEQFHQDGQADDELAASTTLVEGLLGQGKFAEAAQQEQDSQALAAKSTNQLNRLEFDLAAARVELAMGHLAEARPQLQRTRDSARPHHLLGVELETQLALAELKTKHGQNIGAQADLVALEKLARGKGFGLIADKALSVRNHGTKEIP